jgi:hypothetical protein
VKPPQTNKDFIKLRFSKPLAAERKAAHEYTEIADHFQRWDTTRREYNVKPENLWNTDETGWRVGSLRERLVFTFANIKAVYLSDPDTRESITTIESCNTIGDAAPGFIIMPGKCLLEKYVWNDIPDEVTFTTNEETGSGYSNDILAIDWFRHWEEAI